jgi:hypothetical protein
MAVEHSPEHVMMHEKFFLSSQKERIAIHLLLYANSIGHNHEVAMFGLQQAGKERCQKDGKMLIN